MGSSGAGGLFGSGGGIGGGAADPDDPYANIDIDLTKVKTVKKPEKVYEEKTEEEKAEEAKNRSTKSNLKKEGVEKDKDQPKKGVKFGK